MFKENLTYPYLLNVVCVESDRDIMIRNFNLMETYVYLIFTTSAISNNCFKNQHVENVQKAIHHLQLSSII